MTTEVMIAAVSVVAASAGALFFAVSLRKKYETEMQQADEENGKRIAEAIDAARIQEMLMRKIESSQKEIEHLQKKLDTLKKADEKMNGVAHVAGDIVPQKAQ